jgi:hypothetical protein
MKRHLFMPAIIIAALLLPLISSAALVPSSTEPVAGCPASIKVAMQLTARFVSLPDEPSFTAKGQGELCYELGHESAKIRGSSIPELTFEAIDPPPGLADLSVLVGAMPGTRAEVDWSAFPEIRLRAFDLRVRAYERKAAAVADDAKPFVDIILSDLALSTAPIAVEGEKDEGFLDAETLSAKLVGKATLPDADDPHYQEWLAGKDVLLELRVQIENPFQKR